MKFIEKNNLFDGFNIIIFLVVCGILWLLR